MILETFRQALINVWNNKLRSFLTMLGIIIGVMAVIVIVGLGNGMTQSVRRSFSAMGLNSISIGVWSSGTRAVSVEDMYQIVRDNPRVLTAVSPNQDFNGTVKVGTETYRNTSTSGVDEQYLSMKNYTVAAGRGLQYMDIKDHKQVCVIGAYVNRVAFGGNAVGQTIKVGANKFRIVGVLNAKVSDVTQQEGSDDDYIYIPYTTALRLSNQSSVSSYTAIMANENAAVEAKAALEDGIYAITHSEDNYSVYSMVEWMEQVNSMVNLIVLVLTAIAGISLLVGGIGIMNIMLVSVTERTREIGIRKAMGAKESSILAQFITEAAVTSALGGIIGIGFGYVASAAANQVLPYIIAATDITDRTDITVSPSAASVAIAFSISVGIGILFGYLPARRAARLNPIEALRYD